YLHMMTGALAVGGLFVALLGRFRAERDPELAERALQAGMRTFFVLTLVNICLGTWYLLSLERQNMLLFMGRNLGATISFSLALLLAAVVLVTSFRRQLYATLAATVLLVYLMSFLRAWLRTDLLAEYFNLGQLQVVPQYSPLIFFLLCLVIGAGCVVWLLVKTMSALAAE
ncbi:MAG: hypothetical protein WBW79_17445, partial [Desulfocapsaceae bacterium]